MQFTIREFRKTVKRIKKKEIDEAEETSTPPKDAATPSGGSKWESGVTRGVANPIDDKKKWTSNIKRGKANPIDDKSKWESGATRGKANPIK